MNKSSKKVWIGLLALAAILTAAVCVCSAIWVTGGVILARLGQPVVADLGVHPESTPFAPMEEAASAQATQPFESAAATASGKQEIPPAKPDLDESEGQTLSDGSTPGSDGLTPSVLTGAFETLKTLENSQVPENDLVELARRLGGITRRRAGQTDQSVPAGGRRRKLLGDGCQ